MRIEAKEIEFRVGGRVVLKGVNFAADPEKLTLLIGPNGAGKTTLLKILALLLAPSAGEVFYDGVPVSPSDTLSRRRISMLPQKPVLLNASVHDNLLFPLRLRGMAGDGSLARKWLEEVGLDAKFSQNALTLSGGEAQRLALARALIYRPEALFLDEPFLNLDPLSERIIAEVVKRLRDDRRTVVLCLHNLERGFAFADHVCFLEAGEVVRRGAPDSFLPTSVSQARFLGVENLFSGEIRGGYFFSRGVRLQVATGYEGRAWVGIRGEHVILSLSPLSSSARNVLKGEVAGIAEKGLLVDVEVSAVLPFRVLITRQSAEELKLARGIEVYLVFKTSSVLIFPA